MTLNPYDEQKQERRERASAIELIVLQAGALQEHYQKRSAVSHSLLARIVKSVLKIGKHIPIDDNHKEAIERTFRDAEVGQMRGLVDVRGNKIHIDGVFDLDKLKKELLW